MRLIIEIHLRSITVAKILKIEAAKDPTEIIMEKKLNVTSKRDLLLLVGIGSHLIKYMFQKLSTGTWMGWWNYGPLN